MNSKELLENLEDNGRDYLLPVRIYKQIKQSLDRLERIEIALNILKNKRVNISKLLTTPLIAYNSLAILFGHDKLTEEEYELLKEVLEED